MSFNFTLCKVCTLLLFMDSMFPWYMWNNQLSNITLIITALSYITLILIHPNHFILSKKKLGLIIILCLFFLWNIFLVGGILGRGVLCLNMLFVILLKYKSQSELLEFITKWFARFLLVSLICYILFLFGININPTYLTYNDGRYPCWNYYLFLIPTYFIDMFRFSSIFMEPGHLTMGLVPLIVAHRFDLKNKYVLILFIVEIATFSLAGYITMFTAFLLFNWNKKHIKQIFYATIICLFVLFVLHITNNDSFLDHFLWRRLEIADGNISGYNRTTESLDDLYNSILNSPDKWTGRQNLTLSDYGANAGFQIYVVQYGLVGLFLSIFLYSYNYFISFKYEVGVMTLVSLLLLSQNAYPFWFCILTVHILGCTTNTVRKS